VKSSRRRLYAALSVVAAATTGTVLTMTPAAFADGGSWPATNGSIAVAQSGGGVALIDPANPSATPKVLPGSGTAPTWSPTGARIASVAGGRLVTERYDGTDLRTLPATITGNSPQHPTYAFYGDGLVYGDGGRLEVAPSDGAYDPSYLLSTTQEPAGTCDFDPTAALGDTIYFVRSADCSDTNASIWSYDADSDALTQITEGFAPALSADSSKLAFARVVDGHTELFTADPDGTGATQLTQSSDGFDYGSFSWAPDGTSILAQASNGGTPSVVQIDPTSGAVTQLAAGDATPAWQPLRQAQVARVYGSNSAATNIAASRWTWAPAGKDVPGLLPANSAVIVSNTNEYFASLGVSLADKKGGPVLTTTPTSLDSSVQSELTRILPKGKTVYIVGGTSIVSSSVSTKLTSLGYKVTRLGSSETRFATSVSVAKTITSAPKYVFLATGEDYHSILEAEAAAGSDGSDSTAVALMTDNSTMTESVYTYLNTLNPDKTAIITVGTSSQTALLNAYKNKHLTKWPSDWGYYPVTASTNVGTSVNLAKLWWSSPAVTTVASGTSWKDGVAAYSSMAFYGPVMWATTASLDSPVKTYLLDESASLEGAVVFGGTGSISTATADAIGDATVVPGNWTLVDYLNGDAPTLRSKQAARDAGEAAPAATRAAATDSGTPVHNLGTPTRVTR
jgi:hypothetical protein